MDTISRFFFFNLVTEYIIWVLSGDGSNEEHFIRVALNADHTISAQIGKRKTSLGKAAKALVLDSMDLNLDSPND